MKIFKRARGLQTRRVLIVYTGHRGSAVIQGNGSFDITGPLTELSIRQIEEALRDKGGLSWACVINIIWLEE